MKKIKYDIDVSISSNIFRIEVSNLIEPWFIKGYYLYKDGSLIKKVVRNNLDPIYEFNLDSDGTYFVSVYINDGKEMQITNSDSVLFFTDETKGEFEKLLKKKTNKKYQKKLKLFPLKRPFQNFAIVISNNELDKKSVLNGLPKNFYCSEIDISNRNALLISSEKMIVKDDKQVSFSGFCKYKDDILIGNQEIDKVDNYDELPELIGNFTFFVKDNNKIIIGKDYFGTGIIFYYDTPSYTIVSNEYHLLLILLNNLKIKASLNDDVTIANLCFIKGQLFEQHPSKQMEVQGVYQLAFDKYILIENGKLSLKNTSMVKLLEKKFDMNDYEKLLKKAADEIKENVDVVYNLDKFKNVIVDVTGGADSRIIYAAVTNIDDKDNKIQIHSADDKRTKDIDIAIPLVNLYGYNYDTVPEKLELENAKNGQEILRSLYMGTYYCMVFYKGKRSAKNTIRLMGAGGEGLVRPYYTRFLFHDEMSEINDAREFVGEYVRRRMGNCLLDKCGLQSFINVFSDEIDNTLGDSTLQRFENTYIMLRNGIHCCHRENQDDGFIEWFPIYSKTAFFLKMKTLSLFGNSKLAFDLIQYLNPVISVIPFEKDNNNIEYNKIKDTLINQDIRFKNLKIMLNNDRTEWERTNLIKKSVTKRNQVLKTSYSRKDKYAELCDLLIYFIQNSNENIKNKVGLPLYHWIKNNKDTNNDLTVIYNKLYSLVDQINYIK